MHPEELRYLWNIAWHSKIEEMFIQIYLVKKSQHIKSELSFLEDIQVESFTQYGRMA